MQERLRENQGAMDATEYPLYLGLLGASTLQVRGHEVRKLSRSVKWLMALFAVKRSGLISREGLAETIWPETSPERSAFYLRRSLTELRAALGPECYRLTAPTRATLCFDFTDAFCDAIAFDHLVDLKQEASLEAAVALYQGTFLEECSDGWAATEQTRLRERYLTTLETLSQHREARGDLTGAMDFLRRVVNTDPLRETAQRSLMRLLGQLGDAVGVERQYRDFRNTLRETFQIEPAPETIALYRDLRAEARSLPVSPVPAAARPFHNLPHALTSFIGRHEAKEQIRAALRTNRIVTLVGPGGVGKTRLALAAAEAEAENHSAGVCFADMTAAGAEADVYQTLAAALDLHPGADITLPEALRRFLQPRHLLLIVDNAEHLVTACACLADELLQTCPALTILCTSRQPLCVAGEVVLPVAPLALQKESPSRNADTLSVTNFMACESALLLMERIHSAAPSFRLNPSDVPAIASICRRLDGLPLALELVAIRFRSLSPQEIAERLDIRFHLLSNGSPGRPRHRTLHAALDWSYELLSPAEQTVLCHLSSFRGGWTLEAAEAVCSPEKKDIGSLLTALVDKSLVVYECRDGQWRYRLLEMTRQYVDERLEANERPALQQRHAEFFYGIAQSADAAAHSWYFPEKSEVPWRETDNFRAAHAWYQQQDIEKALWLEFFLYATTLWLPENISHWISRLEQQPMPPTRLGLRVTYCIATWALWSRHPACEFLLTTLLESARLCRKPFFQTVALDLLGILEAERGNLTRSMAYMEEALQVAPANTDVDFISRLTSKAAVCSGRLGNIENAVTRLETQIRVEKQREEWSNLSYTLLHAGELLFEQELYEQAQVYWHEGALLAEQWHPAVLPYLWQKLGWAALRQKEYARAKEYLNRGLIVSQRNGTLDRQGWAEWDLAEVCFQEGSQDEAEAHLRKSILAFQENHEPHTVMQCLMKWAKFCVAWGHYAHAAILLGSVDRACEEYRLRESAKEQTIREQLVASLRQSAAKEEFENNRKWGRQMILARAVDFAMNAAK